MPNPADCPFCHIHQRVLKENKRAVALLSNPRKMPGHFLVIPKRHLEKPWELTKDEILDIFELINFVEQRVVKKIKAGCDVRQNYRPFMKQDRIKVNHVHYHVMPRTFKDELYDKSEQFETDMFVPLSKAEHDAMAQILL